VAPEISTRAVDEALGTVASTVSSPAPSIPPPKHAHALVIHARAALGMRSSLVAHTSKPSRYRCGRYCMGQGAAHASPVGRRTTSIHRTWLSEALPFVGAPGAGR
jgi:hypothetical protein